MASLLMIIVAKILISFLLTAIALTVRFLSFAFASIAYIFTSLRVNSARTAKLDKTVNIRGVIGH